jgi:hypothetical protein
MIGLLMLVGIGIDVGRLYVTRMELQTFADEAALAAAFELDGTPAGMTRAENMAAAGPSGGGYSNLWNFGTTTITSVAATFASSPTGTFISNPTNDTGLRYVKVTASANINMYFLPLAPGIASSQTPSAYAIAGQNPQSSMGDGLAPFSPTAHNVSDANFGFTAGTMYTLRWAPSGRRNKAGGSCAGDNGFDPGSSDDRGYVDVGQGTGASNVRAAVVNNNFLLPSNFQVGSTLNMLSGQESVPTSVQERFDQDSDTTATTYSTYNGNGRRLLTVVINDGGSTAKAVGFALFFLQPTPCGTKNTTPCCAEYVGPAVIGSAHKGAGGAGLYEVQLAQ